jgi:hypothetical protein
MKNALVLLLAFFSGYCFAETYRLHSIEANFSARPVYKENGALSGIQAIIGNDIYSLAEWRGTSPFTSTIFDGWAVRVISAMQEADPKLRFDDIRPEVKKFGDGGSMEERIFTSSGFYSLGRSTSLPFVTASYGRVEPFCSSFYQAGVLCTGSDSDSARQSCLIKLQRFIASFRTYCTKR